MSLQEETALGNRCEEEDMATPSVPSPAASSPPSSPSLRAHAASPLPPPTASTTTTTTKREPLLATLLKDSPIKALAKRSRERLLHQLSPPSILGFGSSSGSSSANASPLNHLLSASTSNNNNKSTTPQPPRAIPNPNHGTLVHLPPEVMYHTFQFLLRFDQSFSCVCTLSLVCRYWFELTQHTRMWELVAKQFFVAYPLVQRLSRAAPIDVEDEAVVLRIAPRAAATILSPSSSSSASSSGQKNNKEELSALYSQATTAVVTDAALPLPLLEPEARAIAELENQRRSIAYADSPMKMHHMSAFVSKPHHGRTLSASGVNPASVASVAAAAVGLNPAPVGTGSEMEKPSNRSVRKGLRDVQKYIASRRYHNLVQRRRAFVIHAFFSLALLCVSMALLTAVCASEGLDPITLCNADTSFHFVWCAFVSVFGAVIANIVMETHFEPQPLIRRLRMHTQLIQVSAIALTLGLFFFGVPTMLIQYNVRERSMPWLLCFSPLLLALVLWQVEVLVAVREDIRSFMHVPYFNSWTMYNGFSNSTPTLFMIALWCIAEYIERGGEGEGSWMLLFIGTLPGGLALFTLTIVFLLDYSLKHQESDLVAGVCMAIANVFPVLIATSEKFRGFMLVPIVVASFGFFLGHFNDLRKRVDAALFDPDGERILFDED